ncbi:hypothetical protein QUA56_30680 [Microcoleus sp. N3A4]|uniref:hypothetical protein n=1 Tax=Microcoleus sp. N3A4 TaxID=3055379 RepID=UPI002FD4E225
MSFLLASAAPVIFYFFPDRWTFERTPERERSAVSKLLLVFDGAGISTDIV